MIVPQYQGATLPTCLLLIVLLMMIGSHALNTATQEARLGQAVRERQRLFRAAEQGIARAMAYAATQNLPATGSVLLPDLAGPVNQQLTIHAMYTDNECADWPGTRTHYEIHATATSETGGWRQHRQGFFLCREDCNTAGCVAAETGPVPAYWTTGDKS